MVTSVFDLEETVNSIIAVERASLDKRIEDNEKREAEVESLDEIKTSIKTLESSLEALTEDKTFNYKTAASSESSIVSAVPETGAAEIYFDIEVVSLAEAARSQSALTLLGAGKEATNTTVESGEINSGGSFDPNENVISGTPGFESGSNLSAGSFKINNQTIIVDEDDTVNTILTKINGSGANVLGWYDETEDKVVLEHKESGQGYSIELSDDSTGFFDELKLGESDRTETTGSNGDLYENIEDTSMLSAAGSSVQEGFFTINDFTFYVDPSADSLDEIIKNVNASDAGVSMFYDESSDKVTISADDGGQTIELKNDTSGFLAAIGFLDDSVAETEKTINGTSGEVTINGSTFSLDSNKLTLHGTEMTFYAEGSAVVKVEADDDKAVNAIAEFVTDYNYLADKVNEMIDEGSSSAYPMKNMLTSIRRTIQDEVENTGTYSFLSEVGISFSRGILSGRLEMDEEKLRSAISDDRESVQSLFAYDNDSDNYRDDGGLAVNLEDYLYKYSRGTFGMIDKRKDNISKLHDNMEVRIADQESYFETRYATLLTEMISYQTLLNKLEAQQARLLTIQTDFDFITGKSIS